jgi:hypothetical protein
MPDAPSAVTQNIQMSTLTSIYVQWNYVQDPSAPITGYQLYMDQGNNGNFQQLFDGAGKPGILAFLAANLTTGRAYRFRVRALNFNGAGPFSPDALIYTCLPPLHLDSPKYVDSTETTLTLSWNLPSFINGCPIQEMKLFSDNGAGGPLTTLVNTYNPDVDGDTLTFTGA